MSAIPQHVTDVINSLIEAYPTGLPEGIQININLSVPLEATQGQAVSASIQGASSLPVTQTAPSVEPPAAPAYKGPFLGLYRVIARNPSKRIKIRSDFDMAAPEASVHLTPRQYEFIRALNASRPQYLENNGYIYRSEDGLPYTFYKQFGYNNQLLVISEIKRVGSAVMGRVVGIGEDPYLSDPKPLDPAVTNHKTTPWLVHLIEDLQVYAPILTADSSPGWVNMQEVEKVR
jgi:hypothetical protein